MEEPVAHSLLTVSFLLNAGQVIRKGGQVDYVGAVERAPAKLAAQLSTPPEVILQGEFNPSDQGVWLQEADRIGAVCLQWVSIASQPMLGGIYMYNKMLGGCYLLGGYYTYSLPTLWNT